MSDVELRDYVNMSEAAKLLGVMPATLKTWVNDKTIYVVRPPGCTYRRVPRSEIVRILRGQVADHREERRLHEQGRL